MRSDILFLLIVAWFVGMTFFIMYWRYELAMVEVDDGLTPPWDRFILLDDELLALDTVYHPYPVQLAFSPFPHAQFYPNSNPLAEWSYHPAMASEVT